jgi:hypothetical protein
MINIYELQNNIENSTIIVYANSNSGASKDLMCVEMYARFGVADRVKN